MPIALVYEAPAAWLHVAQLFFWGWTEGRVIA
jgi:hypothetical protein